jgi:O-antigen/teichoic acid export membrane protein
VARSPLDPSSPPAETAPVPKPAVSLTLSSGAVFTAQLLTQLIGFIGTLFFYKRFGLSGPGIELLGTVQFFLLIGTSINGIGDLRLGTAYTFFIARGKKPQDNTSVYLFVRMLMVALAGATLFLLAPSVGLTNGQVELTSLGIFVALPIAWSFSTVYNQLYIGLGNSVRAQYPSLIEACARLPFIAYAVYYNPTILGMTAAYVAGAVASTIFSAPAVIRHLQTFSWSEGVKLFRFAWPLMGALVLNYLVTNMVPLLVEVGLGRYNLSIFLAANGWRVLALSLPSAVGTPLFPYIAGLHKQERYQAVREGIWQALRYTSILLVPGVLALVVYRTNFLLVFSTKLYAGPGALPLAILVISAIPLALSQIIQTTLGSIGRQRLELYLTGLQVAVLVVAVVLFLPPWGLLPASDGLVAASVAVLLSSIAAFGLNTYFLEKLVKVRIQVRSILGITASAIVAVVVVSRLNKYIPVNTSYELLAAVLLCFAVYFVVLALVGELSKEDVRRIGGSLGLPHWLVDGLAKACWRATSPGLPPIDLASAPGLRPLTSTELPETFTGTRELPDMGTPTEEELDELDLSTEGPPK